VDGQEERGREFRFLIQQGFLRIPRLEALKMGRVIRFWPVVTCETGVQSILWCYMSTMGRFGLAWGGKMQGLLSWHRYIDIPVVYYQKGANDESRI
jgi:hypothetical protein